MKCDNYRNFMTSQISNACDLSNEVIKLKLYLLQVIDFEQMDTFVIKSVLVQMNGFFCNLCFHHDIFSHKH